MTFPEVRLRTGLPAVEAKAFAKEASSHPEWVEELIRISSDPDGGTVPERQHGCFGTPPFTIRHVWQVVECRCWMRWMTLRTLAFTGNCSKRCWKRQRRSSDGWAQNCLTSGWDCARMPAFPWPWSMWACCCCTPRESHLAQRWRRCGANEVRTQKRHRWRDFSPNNWKRSAAAELAPQDLSPWGLGPRNLGFFFQRRFPLGRPCEDPEPCGDWLSLE